jgi:hypothetical protein
VLISVFICHTKSGLGRSAARQGPHGRWECRGDSGRIRCRIESSCISLDIVKHTQVKRDHRVLKEWVQMKEVGAQAQFMLPDAVS